MAVRDGLRLTSPARTLIDLAATASARQLERTLDEMHVRGLVGARGLAKALKRNRGRPGVPALRAVLVDHELGSTRTQTGLEERVFELLRAARLGRFECQVPLPPYTVDFLYPAERVIVEADGAAAHGRRRRSAQDAARNANLKLRGYETVRMEEDEAYGDPAAALERVRRAVTAGRRFGR